MAGDLRELVTLEQMREQRRVGASRLLRAAWAEIARLQEEAIARKSRLKEVEALLAAERERCARVCDDTATECRTTADDTRSGMVRSFILSQAAQASRLAAAIRSLAPQTIGDEG